MNRFIFLTFFQLFFAGLISAQKPSDSIASLKSDTLLQPVAVINKDSLIKMNKVDSISKKPKQNTSRQMDLKTLLFVQQVNQRILQHHPYFGFGAKPTSIYSTMKEFHGKEILFYVLIFLLLIFAFFRLLFPKYFNDLFRLFFRTTLKQRQIREQLMQTPLPSLLFNCFFVATTALYFDFLLIHFKLTPINDFWLMYLYCGIGLSVIYLGKFLGLKFSGWVFNMEEATDAYIFIIFIVNKVIGIFLLPFLVLLAFAGGNIYLVALAVSLSGIAILLAYRFILSYNAVRNQIKVNLFHFFLYICAFEIVPLLLIYKTLLFFFR